MTSTCAWPERNPVTRQLCRSIAYTAPGTGGKAFCPHHIGVARERSAPVYPVRIERSTS